MNKKGFTLIELLVVVAIIGILAAVGVVAYNGYTTGAKNNAVKQIHKNIAMFMSAEIKKCSIGGEVILNKLVSGTVTAQADLCPKINNWTDPNSATIASAFEKIGIGGNEQDMHAGPSAAAKKQQGRAGKFYQ